MHISGMCASGQIVMVLLPYAQDLVLAKSAPSFQGSKNSDPTTFWTAGSTTSVTGWGKYGKHVTFVRWGIRTSKQKAYLQIRFVHKNIMSKVINLLLLLTKRWLMLLSHGNIS